jgi:hypothetical protein
MSLQYQYLKLGIKVRSNAKLNYLLYQRRTRSAPSLLHYLLPAGIFLHFIFLVSVTDVFIGAVVGFTCTIDNNYI